MIGECSFLYVLSESRVDGQQVVRVEWPEMDDERTKHTPPTAFAVMDKSLPVASPETQRVSSSGPRLTGKDAHADPSWKR